MTFQDVDVSQQQQQCQQQQQRQQRQQQLQRQQQQQPQQQLGAAHTKPKPILPKDKRAACLGIKVLQPTYEIL